MGNLFVLSFLRKIEISPTDFRNLKYCAGQEIQPRPTRLGDISQQEIPNFSTCDQQADWCRNRRNDHLLDLREARRDGQNIQDDANIAKLRKLINDLEATDHRLILCAKNTIYWMTGWVTKVTGTVLAATEFRNVFARVMMLPP